MAQPIHTMVRVRDEEKSVDFYRRAFGLEVADRVAFDDFVLIYMRDREGGFEVELTVNFGYGDNYTHGSGYGHLAFCVDSLAEEHSRLLSEGFLPTDIKEIGHQGALLARFFFVQDPDGYKIEVIESHGRFALQREQSKCANLREDGECATVDCDRTCQQGGRHDDQGPRIPVET